jgi:hypothetical protein
MIYDVLQKEIEKSNNTIYASEGLLESIEHKESYSFLCRFIGKNMNLEIPILAFSKSKNKTSIKLLIESKNLTDIILVNYEKIEIFSSLDILETKELSLNSISYKIKHHIDDIYKLNIKLKIKENQNGI